MIFISVSSFRSCSFRVGPLLCTIFSTIGVVRMHTIFVEGVSSKTVYNLLEAAFCGTCFSLFGFKSTKRGKSNGRRFVSLASRKRALGCGFEPTNLSVIRATKVSLPASFLILLLRESHQKAPCRICRARCRLLAWIISDT